MALEIRRWWRSQYWIYDGGNVLDRRTDASDGGCYDVPDKLLYPVLGRASFAEGSLGDRTLRTGPHDKGSVPKIVAFLFELWPVLRLAYSRIGLPRPAYRFPWLLPCAFTLPNATVLARHLRVLVLFSSITRVT